MIVLDASVWVSIVLAGDVHRAISRQWARQWMTSGGRLIVPVLFLAEVAGAVSRQSGHAALGRQASNTILTNAAFQLDVVDRSLAESAARRAADSPLKGSDAVYVALAERLSVPLITWDQEQLVRAAPVIQASVPTI